MFVKRAIFVGVPFPVNKTRGKRQMNGPSSFSVGFHMFLIIIYIVFFGKFSGKSSF